MKRLELSIDQALTGLNEKAHEQKTASKSPDCYAPEPTEAINLAFYLTSHIREKLVRISDSDEDRMVSNYTALAVRGDIGGGADNRSVYTRSQLIRAWKRDVDEQRPLAVERNRKRAWKSLNSHPDDFYDRYYAVNEKTSAVSGLSRADAYHALERVSRIIKKYQRMPADIPVSQTYLDGLERQRQAGMQTVAEKD